MRKAEALPREGLGSEALGGRASRPLLRTGCPRSQGGGARGEGGTPSPPRNCACGRSLFETMSAPENVVLQARRPSLPRTGCGRPKEPPPKLPSSAETLVAGRAADTWMALADRQWTTFFLSDCCWQFWRLQLTADRKPASNRRASVNFNATIGHPVPISFARLS